MAFGKVDPAEVIGMTQDELKSRLDKVGALETKLAEMETSHKASSDAILARLDALKPKPDPDPSPDPDVDFLADPSRTLDSRLKPIASQTLQNTIMLQHRVAREAYPKDFDRWGTEIAQKMSELSAEQQADPRVWTAMVLMIRGSHAADLEKDGAQGKYAYLEPVSAGLKPDPKTSDNLSVAEREMVRTLKPFGMTPEKYNKGKERLRAARSSRLGRFAEVG